MIYLFCFEFTKYFEVKTTSEMLVDLSRGSNKLNVNLDITMHHLPCQILAVDVSDFMGTHALNVQGTLVKSRLSKEGKTIETITEKSKNSINNETFDLDQLKTSLEAGEGCRLVGAIEVLRVPGNFHISSHPFGKEIAQLIAKEEDLTFDLSHTINHISFGNDSDIHYIKHHFTQYGNLVPLDGLYTKDEKNNKLFEYYLNIVPTTYIDLNNNKYHLHQFTSNKNLVKSGMLIPTIYFRYDTSPILVKFTQYKPNRFKAIINVCAIFGGMFTIAGILDTIILKFARNVNLKSN